MRSPGKKVGTKIYIHRQYENLIVTPDKLKYARWAARRHLKEEYTCIRYDTKTKAIAFQVSPDFDTADEPIVGMTVTVYGSYERCTVTNQKKDPQIWHHKWMWVADDYEGFDVEASKARSKLWEPHVSKEEKRKIGYRSFWNKIEKRWK